MWKTLPACQKGFALGSLLICVSSSSTAQELIQNGNFEGGRLPPWSAIQVSGSSVGLVAEDSPFTSVYGPGSSSVRLNDDNADFEQPSLSQEFTPTASILFGFDFKIPELGDPLTWYVGWRGENDTTAFFFGIGGADGASIELNQDKIATLEPNVWYHIEGWADALSETVEGTVVNTLGERSNFQSGFPFGVKSTLNGVLVSDGNASGTNLQLDNFYSRLVTLAISQNAQGQDVLSWSSVSFSLQTSTVLGADAQWSDVPATGGSYTNTLTGASRFFRLVH